ncbi:MAG: flagellar biosynthesis protein FlhB [Armatimonadota bacterium]
MAGGDSDKTEEPTEHKLREARKKGQVFKSQDIIATALLLATAGLLGAIGSWMYVNITEFVKTMYRLVAQPSLDKIGGADRFFYVMFTYAKIVLPLFAVAFLTAILANIAQIKFIFSTESMNPKLSKLSPIEGFKRIFSAKSLMEFAKQAAKLIVVSYICYKVITAEISKLVYSPTWDLHMTLHLLGSITKKIIGYSIIAMVAIAIADYMFQKKQFMKQMKMSIQELKDEYKQTEGDPQVKAKVRQLMRQRATSRMMEEVPKASAVITNPTHLAVAIQYVPGEMAAPKVVAKGEKLVAVQIKIVAEDHEVPIIENIELARALAATCKIGDYIPVELYKAVAEILAYLMKLKRKRELKRRRQQVSQKRK